MRKISLIILFFISSTNFAQNTKYFQQEVNTEISVKLIDSLNIISAYERIEYTNNSELSLDCLYFHIWPNAYKNLETDFAKEKIKNKDQEFILNHKHYEGFIDSLDFVVDGSKIEFKVLKEHEDIVLLSLNKAIKPGQTIIIETPFRVFIPWSISRMGHTKSSYQLTQWFPKPAVYDKNGWHYFPYLEQGEFYSEFGKYKVEITVPQEYNVAATGNLESVSTIDSLKTFLYKEENIHDFAWFADIDLTIDIDSVQLPYSNSWVKTITYYHPNSKLWKQANKYIKDAIYYYSLWLGDYPYKTCKAIQSSLGTGGGMEYPSITVIGETKSAIDLETVIMHEVGHNWFYGVLGTNERDFPWMDEGINSAYESRYLETKYPNRQDGIIDIEKLSVKNTKSSFLNYSFVASRQIDQALNLRSEQYTSVNYGLVVYKKGALVINYLRHYMGDEDFDRIMKIYFETWKFKHPEPEDFREIFEKNSTKDLSFFFDDFLKTRKKMDYKILSFRKESDFSKLETRNKKNIKSPLFIQLYHKDSLVKEIVSDGFVKDSIYKIDKEITHVYIDKEFLSLDINRNNNFIKRDGIFKKTEKISFEFVASKPKENMSQIFYSPILAFNTTNGFMLGAAFMSNIVFPNQFEYLVMPMYSFNNQQVSGETDFQYHFETNSNSIRSISPYISSKSYGLSESQNYFQFQAGVEIDFRDFLVSNPIKHSFKAYYLAASQYSDYHKYNHFMNLEYSIITNTWFNPYSFKAKINIHKDFALASIDYQKELSYNKPKTGFRIRFFAGAFLYNNSNNGSFNLSLSGTRGAHDFMYQNTLVGRNNEISNFWGNQFVSDQGGFAIYAPFSSNQWLSSLKLSSTLAIRTPLEFYFTVAAFEGSNKFFNMGLAWETGVQINIIRDVAVIYFPLKVDNQIDETNTLYSTNYIERVRFMLVLNKANIRKFLRNFDQLIF